MNLREQILNANDRPLTPVEVPEWGCTVYLRPLTGLQSVTDTKRRQAGDYSFAPVMADSLCDETGMPLFTAADFPALEEKNGVVLHRLFGRLIEINAIGADAVEAEKKD